LERDLQSNYGSHYQPSTEFTFSKRAIPYLVNFQDFRQILSRIRIFASNHNWLNDLDTFNAYIAGAPVLDHHRHGYIHPMREAMVYLEPNLSEEFNSLQPNNWDSIPAIRSDVPVELYKNAYFRVWDHLWEWVISGRIDQVLMRLTTANRE
jgi:hypothetical protein